MKPSHGSRPPARDTALAEVTRRLRLLRPGEPDVAVRERIWQRLRPHVDNAPAASVAASLQSLAPSEPSPAVADRVWDRLQTEIEADPRERRPVAVPPLPARRGTAGARRLHPAFAAATLALIVVLATVNSAAQAALPGAALYPVKRGWEEVRWALTVTPDGRAHLALLLADLRLAEAGRLVAQGSDPALVSGVIADALASLEYAADQLPPAAVAARLEALETERSQWPAVYQTTTNDQIDNWLNQLPPAGSTALAPATQPPATLIPPLGATPTPLLTLPPVATNSLPELTSTPVPPTTGPSHTPIPPSATPGPQTTATTPTPTPRLGRPLPTLVLPTLPLPTLVIPTLPLPTVDIPTLPLPTIVIPPLPLPTIVIPTLDLPTLPTLIPPLFPTRTPTPPGATPTPTRTPTSILSPILTLLAPNEQP